MRSSAHRLSSDATSTTATTTVRPASTPATTSMSLPANPENGGIPTRESRPAKYAAAISGSRRARPCRSASRPEPYRTSTAPVAVNREVMTTMWWIM